MSRRSPKTTIQALSPPALDPRTLGRPMHLLGQFGEGLRERLAHCLARHVDARHGPVLDVGPVTFDTTTTPCAADALPGGTAHSAGLTVSLDRRVMLRMLESRYGLPRAAAPEAGTDADAPAVPAIPAIPATPSASERRIAARLGAELLDLLANHIGVAADPVPAARHAPARHSRAVLRGTCRIREAAHDELGHLRFTLDASWQARVYAALAPDGLHARAHELKPDLPNQLAVTLHGRLPELRVALDELLDLRAGSLIPIRIGQRAQVVIGATSTFTAQVVEHDGKLCLTAFEDTE